MSDTAPVVTAVSLLTILVVFCWSLSIMVFVWVRNCTFAWNSFETKSLQRWLISTKYFSETMSFHRADWCGRFLNTVPFWSYSIQFCKSFLTLVSGQPLKESFRRAADVSGKSELKKFIVSTWDSNTGRFYSTLWPIWFHSMSDTLPYIHKKYRK